MINCARWVRVLWEAKKVNEKNDNKMLLSGSLGGGISSDLFSSFYILVLSQIKCQRLEVKIFITG